MTRWDGITRMAECHPDRKHKGRDLCHKTGAVRGLLCQPCNQGIGHLADDPVRLRNAARYVEVAS